MALSSPLAASSPMAGLGLRPPQFSEDVDWLPGWFQHLITDGSNGSVKESQIYFKEKVKDLVISQENVSDGKDINALSMEEGGYNSCHLFLSGEDSSPTSFASSPGNVFHFSLRLSSDVDSLFSPTQGLNASHSLVSSSKVLSMQPVKTSVDFRENMHSMVDHRACEQNLLPDSIPKIVKKDGPKRPTNTTGSVRPQEEKSKFTSFKNADISNAVELSIAASEALVIHDLVKMKSVSETLPTEAVLEAALHVKQARLEGLEEGYHSTNEGSDQSDSLSDLDDFTMADAYEDVGLPYGVSIEEDFCSSAKSQAKDVSGAENYHGCNNKYSDIELIPQPINVNDNSAKKPLEVNAETKMQHKEDPAPHSLCCEREKHSEDPGLGPIFHQFVQNTSNVLALNQTVGSDMADLTSNRMQNSVNSSLVGNSGSSKKENLANYLVLDRFRSRWLGGWTNEELDSSSLSQNKAEHIPKFFVAETSFLSESADVIPDENSFVQKLDSKCAIGSQSSIPSESLHKADEGILHSQDVVKYSSLSLLDPLCSVVPCSISVEQADSETRSDKEIDTEFEVDNFQRTSDQNVTLNNRAEQIMSLPDGEDIPITVTNTVQQAPEILTSVERSCRKQLSSLKTYSMIIPNQSLMEKCNSALLLTDQSTGVAAPLYKRSSKGLSASKCSDGKKNEQNHEHFVNHKSNTEITHEKRSHNSKTADRSDIPVESSEERRSPDSPLTLNHRTPPSLLCPKTAGNDINTEKYPNQHVLPETSIQHQQNNNLDKLQAECNKFHDGHVRVRKQVRFSEAEEQLHQKRTFSKLESSHKKCSSVRAKRRKTSKSLTNYVPHMKHSLTNYCRRARTKFLFEGTEFLLTGLSSQKERDIEALTRNSGGVVLSDIPSPPNLRRKKNSTLSRLKVPIILCMRKLQTTKFLYGCAVGASILKVDWLTDCIASGNIIQPEKYMIFPNRNDMKWTIIGRPVRHSNQKHIFERVGVMLHGKHNFCTKLASIIKHGGGQIFKTLQWLDRSIDEDRISVGALIAEDKPCISRHLKYCALERGISIMPSSWIIKSLYLGKLLPFTEENDISHFPVANVPEVPTSLDMSEEI